MERTLVILKPGCLQRGLVGEVISRFEKRGLKLVAMKMVQLDEEILKVHYAHLLDRPFFPWLRDGMMAAPVILCCWEGYSAVQVVRDMAGATRQARLSQARSVVTSASAPRKMWFTHLIRLKMLKSNSNVSS